jgi:tubulin polyglutamylase TTLL1
MHVHVICPLSRYKKEAEKDPALAEKLDFIPVTYTLPGDYSLFVEVFY